ncbi:hypothetical protein ACFO6X_02270 [Giesbergeria sinuosa]|uniref:Uncharacterized protein n=1 Tax=Giesbergeria sinuosa TaxID=80883 RepID=A0ABV9QB56_9BURK
MPRLTSPPMLLGALLLACSSLRAAPAPWYYWSHATSPQKVCAQTAPGPGWVQDSPPFAGPGCQRPLRPPLP